MIRRPQAPRSRRTGNRWRRLAVASCGSRSLAVVIGKRARRGRARRPLGLPPSHRLGLKPVFTRSHGMTIQFQIRGMRNEERLRRQVEADLEELHDTLAVASARVGMQYEREVTPAYQAVALLAVSGPDLHAAARDHTWPAAWQKVVARLREQMKQRRSRQTARQKGQPHLRRPTGRRAK